MKINKILLYILLIVFISTSSYGCALCQINIPKINVNTKVYKLKDKTHFEVVWKFEKRFVSQLIQYDTNENGRYDQDEQDEITKALEDYLKQFNYLTQINYTKRGFTSNKSITIQPLFTKMVFKNSTMYYHFNFDANFILQDNHLLNIKFQDKQDNFNFIIKDTILKKYPNKYFIKPKEHYVQINLNNRSPISTQTITKNVEKNNTYENESSIKQNIFFQQLSKQFKIYKEKIKTIINDIKENNSVSSYLWLLFFSFIYGVLHALGPGHGKTLVASYFLSENRSVAKAFNISLFIGVVHTFSAFLLTMFIYLVLNLLFISFLSDIQFVATKLSAIIIILIALYLLYKKYKSTKKPTNQMNFSIHNPNAHTCGCNACNTKSEDISVILAAGIVPCPGTVTIFIFTFGLGIYYVGFLSAIFMSLGMSLIIFITAYLSIKVRKKSSSNTILQKIFEYASLVFILCLGLFLLLL